MHCRLNGPLTPIMPEGDTVHCKVKVDFGWNREEKYVHWLGKLAVDKGRIVSVTPLFPWRCIYFSARG